MSALPAVDTVAAMKSAAGDTEVEKNDGSDAHEDEEKGDYEGHDEGLQEKGEESWVRL